MNKSPAKGYDRIIDAILKEEPLTVRIVSGAIVTRNVLLSPDEALQVADEVEKEARRESFEGADVIDWIANMRRSAIKLSNR